MPIKLAPMIKKSPRDLERKNYPATPQKQDSELAELLKNTAPRNIPKSIAERFGGLSQTSIRKMIQGVSTELKTASGGDTAILKATLEALKKLVTKRERKKETQ